MPPRPRTAGLAVGRAPSANPDELGEIGATGCHCKNTGAADTRVPVAVVVDQVLGPEAATIARPRTNRPPMKPDTPSEGALRTRTPPAIWCRLSAPRAT